MKSIIFGANGQDGYYLENLLRANQVETISISRSTGNIKADVSEYATVKELIKTYKPSHIFHLAANSTTKHSALFENHDTISTGTINILEAVKKYHPQAKVFITGSGVQFKNSGRPISETDEFEGNSPYSVARIQSVYAARYYRTLGIKTYTGYLSHHESPLRGKNHVSKMIALAVQRIAKGSEETIVLGDISVEKEWTFAGDIAKAIFTLTNQNEVFEATIGSGKAYSIAQWLQQCFNTIGKDWRQHISILKEFSPEYKRLVSNPTTINKLGWFPSIDFPELASMMILG